MICKKHGKLTEDLFYIQKSHGYKTLRCKLCNRETANASRKRRQKQVNEWNRNDRKVNPERYKKYAKSFEKKYPGRKIQVDIARRRGITFEQYQQMFADQDNKCAICGNEETRIRNEKIMKLNVDHCHKTNKTRQLLCHMCNLGIGSFNDNIETLQSAIDYLRKHS